jgi:hypothetical protein
LSAVQSPLVIIDANDEIDLLPTDAMMPGSINGRPEASRIPG